MSLSGKAKSGTLLTAVLCGFGFNAGQPLAVGDLADKLDERELASLLLLLACECGFGELALGRLDSVGSIELFGESADFIEASCHCLCIGLLVDSLGFFDLGVKVTPDFSDFSHVIRNY